MSYAIHEWLNLAVRWAHVFAAIMWIGQTWFFTWLDRRFHEEKQIWMVHSGGFYIVDKQKVPELLPQTLHWFKWEAALTWITGFLLFIIVYYTGGLMNGAKEVGVSIALLIAGWIVYDLLWISPLVRYEKTGAVISYLLLVATTYGLTRFYDGRPAYLQAGAMLGTIMAANVWMRILPAQRQLIAATKAGEAPDMTLADRAKQRSKHNTFIVLPVVFIMISNHFPVATYGHEFNWAILAALVLAGWGAAAIIRSH